MPELTRADVVRVMLYAIVEYPLTFYVIPWFVTQATTPGLFREVATIVLTVVVLVLGTVVLLRFLDARRSAVVTAPKSAKRPQAETADVMAAWEAAQHDDRIRKALDTAITWLYRRQNWNGLSVDGRHSEPAPWDMWGKQKYDDLGISDVAYSPPTSVPPEPGWEPPAQRPTGIRIEGSTDVRLLDNTFSGDMDAIVAERAKGLTAEGNAIETPPAFATGVSARTVGPPRFTVSASASTQGVLLRVRNHGPTGEFWAEVTNIESEHFDPEAEPLDLPWAIAWHGAGQASQEIGPGQSGTLTLVDFDHAAAEHLLAGRAKGYPYVFPSPGGGKGIFAHLAARHIRELRDEVVRVKVRVVRGESSEQRVHTICLRFGVAADICDE